KQKIIETIITNIYAGETSPGTNINYSYENIFNLSPEYLSRLFNDGTVAGRIITTPGNHYIEVDGNVITLLGEDQGKTDENGNLWDWEILLSEYGEVTDGVSLLQLRPVSDIEDGDFDFIGRLYKHPEKNKMYW